MVTPEEISAVMDVADDLGRMMSDASRLRMAMRANTLALLRIADVIEEAGEAARELRTAMHFGEVRG